MEWSSDPDTSFGSSLNPTSSKEDFFSTSQISSTSDIDIKLALGLQIDSLPLSSPISTNPSSSPSPVCSSSLPKQNLNSRKSKILPPSLLLSVTKKVRDGTVSKSDISSVSSDLKTCSSPGIQNGSTNKLLPQMSPLSINSSVDSPFRLVKALDSNISDIDSNSSQLALKLEVSGDSDDKALSATSDTSICTIYSDDETRNKLKVEKPKRQIPNYFISIQFSDPEIYLSLKEVHKSVMKKNGNYSLAVVPLHSLHMTLAVMRLENEEDMARAKSALNCCGNELRPKYRHELLELPLQGLGNFRHSVVFAKVRPGEHVAKLEEIADVVQKRFCEEGLVDDKHNFTPHVTVLKLSRVGKKLTKKTGLKKIYPDIYEESVETYFGTQEVHSLQLCSMLKAKDITGYYHVEHKIDFGTEMTPDDDGTTPMATVNAERKVDFPSETPKESSTKENPEPTGSKNPEDITLQDDTLTDKCSSEKKMKFEHDVTVESLGEVTYPYKSETFIYLSGQENDKTPPTLSSVSQEKAAADDSSAKILATTLPEEARTDNISTVPINLPENTLTSDKPVDDYQEIKILLDITKKILEKEADVSDYETSGEALLQEAVSYKTDLSYNTAVPMLIISPAEPVAEKAALMNITDIDIEVNSTPISLKEASPGITTITDSTSNITPETDLLYNTVVPTLSISPAEMVADKPALTNITNVDIKVNQTSTSMKEASPSITISDSTDNITPGITTTSDSTDNVTPGITTISDSTDNITPGITTIPDTTDNIIPGTPATFQNITLTSDTGVSDVSEVAGTATDHKQVSSPSCGLLGDLELAEEATEGLASSDSIGLASANERPDGHNLVCNETNEDKDASSATIEINGLNIVPPFMKKRRKKMGKCSVM